ncbi:cache domain-containing protein [Undibacterium sp. YM2]|uniref:cache domain-containing protein n=1 Tax=Undibacterium sp. YM2 TaxID=2058625 RepID=UPI0013894FB0|nr:cache domain-containing protein [Undibacterium sp. YM2]
MKILKSLLVLLLLVQSQFVLADDNPADAIAMVEKGLAYMQKNGKDALVQEINNKNPDFINGSIYLYVRGLDGIVIAHPINPKLIGKNMLDLPDADGKYYRKEIIALAKSKGKGWVDYRYNNPVSKQIENKTTYIFRSNDVILEAGIYKGK